MDNEAIFEKQLKELLVEFGPLPESSCEKIIDLSDNPHNDPNRVAQSLTKLQDSIEYLRFSIKYLMFDLEATRRENAYLKALLQKME